jgi:SAM-dependent methyltransferase
MKSLESLRNKQGKLWLNVGAGSYAMPEFVNIDNSTFLQLLAWYPVLKPFIGKRRCSGFEDYRKALKVAPYLTYDCGKPLPLPTESVDHILTSHFLEHLYQADAANVVRGFHRILKPGGTLHVIVPDLAYRARRYVEKIGRDEEAAGELVDSLLFTKRERPGLLLRWREFVGGFGLLHRWMYDETSMRAMVEKAGFVIAAENNSPSAEWRKQDNASQVNLLAVKAPQKVASSE